MNLEVAASYGGSRRCVRFPAWHYFINCGESLSTPEALSKVILLSLLKPQNQRCDPIPNDSIHPSYISRCDPLWRSGSSSLLLSQILADKLLLQQYQVPSHSLVYLEAIKRHSQAATTSIVMLPVAQICPPLMKGSNVSVFRITLTLSLGIVSGPLTKTPQTDLRT